MPAWKPDSYPSMSPYIMVDNAARVIDFLVKVFDGVELRRHETPDGRVMHTEVRIDDSVVMLSDSTDQWPAFPIWLHLYVRDVDATYRRALEAGAEAVQAPVQKGDPDRRGGVKDPAGNTWWISTQLG